MRIFVTGATGHIGRAVAKAFRSKGHTVYGLVRTEEKAEQLSLNEIWPVIGTLENQDSYKKTLEEVEVVVHCAFENSEKGVERDASFIDCVLKTYANSPVARAFIYTSGTWVYGSTGHKVADEATPVNPLDIVKWRPQHEQKILEATSSLLRTVILRPGVVYGGAEGLLTLLFASAQQYGSVGIPGTGSNRWAMIHRQDLAYAYVAAAEKELSNVILNVANNANPTLQSIAEAVAFSAGIPGKIHTLSDEEAKQQLGSLLTGFTIDQELSNARIKRLLGWQIHHLPFNNEADIYYHSWRANQQIQEF